MRQLRNFRNEGTGQSINPKDDPNFKEAMNKYGNMGEDELINQLLQSVRNSKANGTYNPQQMSGYVQMLKPHISEAQYEKLMNVVKIIDNENV